MRKSAKIHSCALRILSGVRPRNCGVSRSRIASSGYRPNHIRGCSLTLLWAAVRLQPFLELCSSACLRAVA